MYLCQSNVKYIARILIFIPLFMFAACGENKRQTVDVEPEKPEVVLPKLIKQTDEYDRYEVHYEPGKMEQWDDPEVLSTPRLQFTWVKPGNPDNGTSWWSIRLDGTDLRQVATSEELYGPEKGAVTGGVPHVRSPNNRYIAYAVHTKCVSCYERRIFDLKTREVTIFAQGPGDPMFQWVDNERLLFKGRFRMNGALLEYNLTTGKITDLYDKFGSDSVYGYYPIKNGKQLIVKRLTKADYYDYESGELLNSTDFVGDHLTADERHWIHGKSLDEKVFLSKLDSNKPIGFLPDWVEAVSILVGLYNQVISKNLSNGFSIAQLGDNKASLYELPFEEHVGNLSIYNVNLISNKTVIKN